MTYILKNTINTYEQVIFPILNKDSLSYSHRGPGLAMHVPSKELTANPNI